MKKETKINLIPMIRKEAWSIRMNYKTCNKEIVIPEESEMPKLFDFWCRLLKNEGIAFDVIDHSKDK